MAEELIELGVVTDSSDLADDAFEYIEDQFPGWAPAAGNLDTHILEDGARMGSELATLILTPATEIFRYYGNNIVKLLPIDPVEATGLTTWPLHDDDGHTIPVGTVITIDGIGFQTVVEVVVPNGDSEANGVEVIAVDPGTEGNALVGPVELVDTLDFVVDGGITTEAPTAGGIDGETDEEYLDRLAREAELFAPRPLTARDVENFSKRIEGIDRVAVLDNYKPANQPTPGDPEETARPLTFTVVPIDAAGQPSSGGVTAALLAMLEANRGTNWDIFALAPTYNVIDVNFEAVAYPGFDAAVVQAAAIEAITQYLDPSNWGQPLYGEQRRWINTPVLRHREIASALDDVDGLDYVSVLEFGIQGTALSENVDVDLTGVVPLPEAGDITGVVTSP